MRVVARRRFLRASRWDVVSYAQERRMGLRLITIYEAFFEKTTTGLDTPGAMGRSEGVRRNRRAALSLRSVAGFICGVGAAAWWHTNR